MRTVQQGTTTKNYSTKGGLWIYFVQYFGYYLCHLSIGYSGAREFTLFWWVFKIPKTWRTTLFARTTTKTSSEEESPKAQKTGHQPILYLSHNMFPVWGICTHPYTGMKIISSSVRLHASNSKQFLYIEPGISRWHHSILSSHPMYGWVTPLAALHHSSVPEPILVSKQTAAIVTSQRYFSVITGVPLLQFLPWILLFQPLKQTSTLWMTESETKESQGGWLSALYERQ